MPGEKRALRIGENYPVFIIAEASANHGQNLNRAISMIKKAKACGVDAVKFQTYTPDTITVKGDDKYFKLKHSQWQGQTLYGLYKKAYTPWKWFKKLKSVADDLGIIFFSTSFDKTSVDLLEALNVKAHKISSFELNDLPLIEYAAQTKKPLMLSTGMATINEIEEAVKTAKNAGARYITLLKCVSNYPANPKDMNLRTIADLKDRFKLPVGLSDHSLGIAVSIAAVSLGARVIEKHFTLSRSIKTADNFFSLEPQEMRELVDNIRIAEQSLGRVYYGCSKEEKENRKYRRSLFAVKEIQKGEKLNEQNIKSLRPAAGIEPKYISTIINRTAKCKIHRGTPLRWNMIQGE